MPRNRGPARAPARSAPTRPSVPAPSRPTGALPPQNRSASTAAGGQQYGQTGQAGQTAAGGGGGMLSNIASTAAGVAIGSSIGHGISSFFGGGSSAAAAAEQNDPLLQSQGQDAGNGYSSASYGRACEGDAKAFTRCLDENKGEHAMSICGWYLEQLKACQQASKNY